MKTSIPIIIFFIISCQNMSTPPEDFKLPRGEDYNLIIQEILIQDTIFINNSGLKAKYIGSSMIKSHINFYERGDTNFVIDKSRFQVFLFHLKYDSFTSSAQLEKDSAYFVFQNNSSKNTKIDQWIIDSFKLAHKQMPAYGYFQFSLPILNHKKTKAYVQVDYICDLGGQGLTYILEKVNKKWKLIIARTRWVT